MLQSQQIFRAKNVRIQSVNHELFTVECNKIALSAYDDKRFICDNGIDTLPYGHKDIRDTVFHNQILDEMDWGDSEESAVNISVEQRTAVNSQDNSTSGTHSYSLFELVENQFSPPDPGLNQRAYTESELEECDSDYGDNGTPEMYRCPFIDGEAVESDSSESIIIAPRSGKRKLEFDSE